MLHVYHSNRFENLAERLAENLAAERRGRGGLGFAEPVDVLVPTLDMGSYVELHVSRLHGAACNLGIGLLQRHLTELITDEDKADKTARPLTRQILQVALLERLMDEAFVDQEEMAAVKRYLDVEVKSAERNRFDPRDTRRFQLARQIATVFEEYTFSRRAMLEAWASGEFFFDEPQHRDIERWQRHLWCELVGEEKVLERDGVRFMPLPDLFDACREAAHKRLERPFHVFGFASLGEEFLRIIEDLSDTKDIHLYLVNPTERDWIGELPDDPAATTAKQALGLHPALSQWGRVGHDTLAQVQSSLHTNETPVSFWRLPTPINKASVLALLQDEIAGGGEPTLRVVPAEAQSALEPLAADGGEQLAADGGEPMAVSDKQVLAERAVDDSLECLACPSLKREVEIVANKIWTLVSRDKDLRFSDIAVTIPTADGAKYIPQVRSTFRRFYDLPVNINSMSLGVQGPMVDAVRMLLALPFGEFRRRDFLGLLVHPNVRSRFRDVDTETWMRWVDELHIVHGASKKDHFKKTYIDRDLFNWTQGLRRLVLGAFLSEPDTGDEARWKVTIGEDDYRPEMVDEGELDTASCLYSLASSLIADAEWLRTEKASLEQWGEVFEHLVETYIHPADTDDADYGEQMVEKASIKSVLSELSELSALHDQDGQQLEVSFRTAYLFALQCLDRLADTTHHRLVGGVVVSSPSHLRNLPFKHVFVLGLGEGKYPGLDPENVLDLRRVQWRRGDILISDRDKLHFLELLLAARQGLHLSWVARESSTGNELPPSSLVSDLKRMLSVVPDEDGGDCLTKVYPLRRYDRSGGAFSAQGLPRDERHPHSGVDKDLGAYLHREAFEEARMHALRERIERDVGEWDLRAFRDFLTEQGSSVARRLQRLACLPGLPSSDDSANSVSANRLPATPKPATPKEVEVRRIRLNYSKLVGYLKTPFQTAAKTQYGIYDDEDDVFAAEREPFKTSHLQDAVVPKSVFYDVLAEGVSADDLEAVLEQRYHQRADQELLKGAWPTGFFGKETRDEHVQMLENWRNNLEKLGPKNAGVAPGDPVVFYSFGRTEPSQTVLGEVELSFGPEETGGPRLEVLLYGSTNPLTERGDRILVAANHDNNEAKRFRTSLSPYLDHIMLSAYRNEREDAPYADRARAAFLFVNQEYKRSGMNESLTFEFPALRPDQARGWLAQMVKALLLDSNEYLLPHEAVRKYLKTKSSGKPADLEAEFQDCLNDDYSSMYVEYGPVYDYRQYPLHPDAEAVVRDRFAYHPALPAEEAE